MKPTRRIAVAIAAIAITVLINGCVSTGPGNNPVAKGTRQADLHTQLAWNYLQRKQYKVAGIELDKALKADPRNSRAHQIYGLLLVQLNQLGKAERHFKRAVQADDTNIAAAEDFASFLCQRGRASEGIERYKAIMDNPLNAEPALTRTRAGMCLVGTGDAVGAEQFFRDALAINPSIREALAGMVQISYERANYLSARGYAQRYVALGDASPNVLLYAAKTEAMLGDAKTSASYAKELRTRFPKSQQAAVLEAQ